MNENSYGILLYRQATLAGDLKLSLLNCEGHRLICYAKGAGLPGSKRRQILEPMQELEWSLQKSRQGHYYLKECQLKKSFHRVQEDLWLLGSLLSYGEFLDQSLLENDPHPEIYTLLRESLESLHEKKTPSCLLRLWGQSLQSLGYLNHDALQSFSLEERYQRGLRFLLQSELPSSQKLSLQEEEKHQLHHYLIQEAEKHLERKLRHIQHFNLASPLE